MGAELKWAPKVRHLVFFLCDLQNLSGLIIRFYEVGIRPVENPVYGLIVKLELIGELFFSQAEFLFDTDRLVNQAFFLLKNESLPLGEEFLKCVILLVIQ